MFHKPDYKGGSIVNLMSSIGKNFGVDLPYTELNVLGSEKLKGYRNIIHIVIDGLGYNYLRKKKKNFLKDNTKARITSVFPSTTSACITSFATGLAPNEHGITGWFVRIRKGKKDIPSTILLFNDRRDEKYLTEKGINPADIFPDFRLSQKIKDPVVLIPEEIKASHYSRHFLGGAGQRGYKGLKDFYSKLSDEVKRSTGKKNYFYGYIPDLDSSYHHNGSSSLSLTRLFYRISRETEKFVKDIRSTNSIIIITADHGLTDGDVKKRININDMPEINKMLDFPLCGEPRAAYCYVKKRYKKDFSRIVRDRLGHAVKVLSKEKMLKEGYFGLYRPHPDLDSRIGDFILVCRENYVIRDFLDIEEVKFNAADHGGLSSDEMFVPLIVIET